MKQDKRPTASDPELVAYLDGELPPSDSVRIGQMIAADEELAERLNLLMRGARPFGEAFEPLLREAPSERLEAMLSAVIEREPGVSGWFPPALKRYWLGAVAAAVAFTLVGAGLDRLVVAPGGLSPASTTAEEDASEDWRRAVAQYLAFYTRDTLSVVPPASDAQEQNLAKIGTRLGLDLASDQVDLPDLVLKRAEIFEYDGKPLGFLAYLDPQSGPISLCIFADSHRDMSPEVEHRGGMNAVSWSADNHDFMLIGRAGVDRLRSLAAVAGTRLNGTGAGRLFRGRG